MIPIKVIWPSQFASRILIATSLLLPCRGLAQRAGTANGYSARAGQRLPTSSPVPQKNWAPPQNQKPNNAGAQPRNHENNRPRAGKWLQEHTQLPPAEQEKALERDPEFQKLAPQRQERLRENLRRLNSMAPQQREKTIQRMVAIEQLPPEKRELLRTSMQQLRQLPEDRRKTVWKTYHNLRNMPPPARAQVMDSAQFKSTLDDNERSILNGLLDSGLNVQGAPDAGPPNPPNH